MSNQIGSVNDKLGADKSGAMVRTVYYAVIVGLGLMLFLMVYLAR